MKNLLFAALVAAGLGAATLPAEAGGRQCGWRGSPPRWCCWTVMVGVEVWRRQTFTVIQNNWHIRCINGVCRCVSGICPSPID